MNKFLKWYMEVQRDAHYYQRNPDPTNLVMLTRSLNMLRFAMASLLNRDRIDT